MLNEQEKSLLRHRGLTEQEVEAREANISALIQCLSRLQDSCSPIRGAWGNHLLTRFRVFRETPYDSPDASMNAIDDLLYQTLCHLQDCGICKVWEAESPQPTQLSPRTARTRTISQVRSRIPRVAATAP
jgi:hypothetical protein